MRIFTILSFSILPLFASAASTADPSCLLVPKASVRHVACGMPGFPGMPYPTVPMICPAVHAGAGYSGWPMVAPIVSFAGGAPDLAAMHFSAMYFLSQSLEQHAISGSGLVIPYPMTPLAYVLPIAPVAQVDAGFDVTIKALRKSFESALDGSLFLGESGAPLMLGGKAYRSTIHSWDNFHHTVRDALNAISGLATITISWNGEAKAYEFNGDFKRPDAKIIKDEKQRRSAVQIRFYSI